MNKEKVVLAYSGGLDTSVDIKWLQQNYKMDVIAAVVDVGQPEDLEEVRKKALNIGAIESYLIEAQNEFARDFILPALKANAVYDGKYPLATALARPLIAKHVVEVANKRKAKAVAHGCTGKGNDQVRFDVTITCLNPDLKIIAPQREWTISREEEIEYAKKYRIPIPVTKKSPYSIDENLWGKSIESGVLENPWHEPPEDAFTWTKNPSQTDDKPIYLEIEFAKGVPIKLEGKRQSMVQMIKDLNWIGGSQGVGRVDQIENRLVGIKSREIYECPAATILIAAHQELEAMTLPREVLHFKKGIEQKYAELVYTGLWYSPLREAFDAFVQKVQETVTGVVRMKLYKGSLNVVGRKSEYSLYDYKLATYDKADAFSHQSAKGFIELWGLPLKIWAKKHRVRPFK